MQRVSADDVKFAARRLTGQVLETPLIQNAALDRRTGGRILVKAECLQVTGSFKFRGALNRLMQLDAEQRRAGVVAFSSGNHAQGIAAAAQRLGIPATVVMPRDAPGIKVENARGYGAEIVFYDRITDVREEIADRLARERGAIVVPSFDDPYIIAGQGTVGLEIVWQARALGMEPDACIVPTGGGGLLAGTCLAIKSENPGVNLYSAEPAGYDDTARSLRSGRRETNPPGPATLCDALMAPSPGVLTFAITGPQLAGGLTVTDEMTIEAIRFAWRELKLVVEPGGAVALAAVLANRIDCRGKRVVIVLSGGNADAASFARWIVPAAPECQVVEAGG
jgi:threonine dehydratase